MWNAGNMTWCCLTCQSDSAWGASSTCVYGDNVKTVQKLKSPKRATGLSSAADGHFWHSATFFEAHLVHFGSYASFVGDQMLCASTLGII